ncbi:BTAD domain-containing putative transcriptional regulator [Streptomyces sp. MUM 203J]|uniref:AfsR/SARP family transcriptional regulator n=1 Tax=Streptomyces sp. MUM 203J TaxID=2791990 RepID=UPI001F04140C|nr:BTAD domain-containing putative transcriptional regulator [Streptomyces sp. MUM 203J]
MLLDRFRVESHGEPVPLCGSAQRLLAFVGLRQEVPRCVVARTLWPEASEAHARGSLRTALWKLPCRARELVRCTQDSLALADGVGVDAGALARSALDVVRGCEALQAEPLLVRLRDQGDLLPDWDDDWVVLEREWLHRLRLHALDTLSDRFARQGLPALALEAALASIRIEPLREDPHRSVVSTHLAEGNLIEALRHYEAFRQLLRAELGIEPSLQFTRMISLERRCTAPRP